MGRRPSCNAPFFFFFSFEEPQREQKNHEWILLEQHQKRFPEQIRLDEGAIKIDAERKFCLQSLTHKQQADSIGKEAATQELARIARVGTLRRWTREGRAMGWPDQGQARTLSDPPPPR